MKSLITLWETLAKELAGWCGTSTDRDIETVTARVKHEGLSFLTITLPAFGKAFEHALEEQRVASTGFPGFGNSAGTPKFLQGFLRRVFDTGTGRLLDDPCVDSIYAIRQLTLLFGKMFLRCSEKRESDALRRYVECDDEVSSHTIEKSLLLDFERVCDSLFRDLLLDVDRKVFEQELVPRHGPGVTADRLLGNQKYSLATWTKRLQEVLPWEYYLAPSPRFVQEMAEDVHLVEPEDETPVKVVLVPKTQKTPRVIAMEPTCMMFMQQALKDALVSGISRDDLLRDLIGFEDQRPNQVLARLGSLEGRLATLDLSEASDRVSLLHVDGVFRHHNLTRHAVMACRSGRAEVHGHGIIPLSKYASMGSALTFPIEAMVFTAAVFVGIERALNRQLTRWDITSFRDQVRVYGDDIIVPVDYVPSVIRVLEDLGFRVNANKSFWNGKFRESCGKDYYAGHDVSVVKVRQQFPLSRKDATQCISLVSLRNQLYERGLWRTCEWLDTRIKKVLKTFPVVAPTSMALGRMSYLGYETQRDHPFLHKPLVKAWVNGARSPINSIDGIGALMKVFLLECDPSQVAEDHLERSGRAASVTLKSRWVSPV